MSAQASGVADQSTDIEWMWQSNPDPWSKSQKPEWSHYSDVENIIIEKAFSTKQTHAIMDGFCIDFKNRVQISDNDKNQQRPVKRLVCKREDKHLREERFMPDPIAPKCPFGGQYGWISPFIIEVRSSLNLEKKQLSSTDENIVPMIVEKAALGIIKEGKLIGRRREAEEMAEQLMAQQHRGIKEIWKCCARLYSLESFLYKKLNEAMRSLGSEEQEQIWRTKIRTLGPFCLLLWDNPFNKRMNKNIQLYRGAQLTPEQIATYQDLSACPEEYRSFQAFTSCSRNREFAENFAKANVLFIMEVEFTFTVDLSPISKYPEEAEELVTPGVCFNVQRVDFDKHKKKHLIYLKLRQSCATASNLGQTGDQVSHSDTQSNTQSVRRVIGYDAQNKDSLGTKSLCRICNLLLRDPIQLNCGHRYCRSCIDTYEGSVITCLICKEDTPRNEVLLDRGFGKDMETLSIICSLCNWTDIFRNYPDHIDTEHRNPICQHCGEQLDSVNSLNLHKSTCGKILVDCALKQYGCEKQYFRINALEHYLTEQHQKVLINLLGRSAPYLKNGTNISSRMDIDEIPRHTTASSAVATNDTATIGLQQVYEGIGVLSGGIQTLSDDAQRLCSESLRYQNSLETVGEELSRIKVSVQETQNFTEALKQNQEILGQDLASLKQTVDDKQFASYDGTLVWKITNFQEKMTDAQSERQTSVYSPPFYSSTTGYKMRARLYPQGDGNARRTHMSLFFVLMRSQNDGILRFPFNYKVTFCLYDQTPQQRHIIDSFRPDTKSNSFQRPRSEMNIASGIPKFFPLAMIQQDNNPYVHDDTMFIKIMVDFGDMPKTLLPYALSLNPGLPTHVQQAMIKQEIERRAQQQTTTTNTPMDVPVSLPLQQNDPRLIKSLRNAPGTPTSINQNTRPPDAENDDINMTH